MKYRITLLILIACRPWALLAIADNHSNDERHAMLIDTGKILSPKKQSVSVGMNYGTDASFFGRTSPQKYPYITNDVIYSTRFGLYAYTSAWKVLGSLPAVDEFDLGVGYSLKFNEDIKSSLSYTHFFFNDNATIIKSSSSNDINFKNTFDWHLLKTVVTADFLYGKSNDFFLTISQSHYFESNFNIFDNKDYITFEPSVSMIFGTQNFVENFSYDHDFFYNHNDPKQPPPDGKPAYANDYIVKNTEFNVLNYSFRFPLAYNRPHYTIEAAYKYSVPVNVQSSLYNSNESFFNLTFYYLFF